MFKMGLFCLGHISSCSSECVRMCSTEANFEVVEVLMFLAGSYSEIWGCLFYSVNMLNRTRQIQEN